MNMVPFDFYKKYVSVSLLLLFLTSIFLPISANCFLNGYSMEDPLEIIRYGSFKEESIRSSEFEQRFEMRIQQGFQYSFINPPVPASTAVPIKPNPESYLCGEDEFFDEEYSTTHIVHAVQGYSFFNGHYKSTNKEKDYNKITSGELKAELKELRKEQLARDIKTLEISIRKLRADYVSESINAGLSITISVASIVVGSLLVGGCIGTGTVAGVGGGCTLIIGGASALKSGIVNVLCVIDIKKQMNESIEYSNKLKKELEALSS